MEVLTSKQEQQLMYDTENSKSFVSYNEYGIRTENDSAVKKCPTCFGRKKYFEKQAYEAKLILNDKGELDTEMEWLLDDPLNLLLATSIRTRLEAVGEKTPKTHWKIIEGYSMNVLSLMENTKKRKKSTAPSDHGLEAKIRQRYDASQPETVITLEHARTLDPAYQKLIASSLFRVSKTEYRLDVRGQNSTYCLKCFKEHKNHIYFKITKKDISQHSYSDNQECKNSKGKTLPVTVDLANLLFGQSKIIIVPDRPNFKNDDETRTKKRKLRDADRREQQALMKKLKSIQNIAHPKESRTQSLNREKKRLQKSNNPIWAPKDNVSYSDVFQSALKPSKKKKELPLDSPLAPRKDANGFVWGAVHLQRS